MSEVYEGIPKKLTLEYAREWISPRVSAKRFAHIEGTAEVAKQLSEYIQVDLYLAQLACLLHDASKETKAAELVEQAKAYGLKLHPIEEKHGHILHGPVGAEVIKEELGLTNKDVLDAIREHTLGAAPMSNLSKVVFLADCLEAGRPNDYRKTIWDAVKKSQEDDLNLAIVVASDLNLRFLLDDHKPIHPKTIEVRNYYLSLLAPAKTPI
jgi:predicted HD superfamily hydrolase involved in NAD metabolism